MKNDENFRKLTSEEEFVIIHKGTERPFSGKYNDFFEKGTYHCKRCNAPLFRSDSKFKSTCGWPSFDDELPGAVKKIPDSDGIRVEIQCANCGAHLGHIFKGEGFTKKNVRYCVNSISLIFVPDKEELKKAYFAGGCFWGVEYLFEKKEGVNDVVSGYMGGNVKNPSYEQVCSGKTGHYETVEVTYYPSKISYEELVKYFFEIHDFSQENGQGPDIGEQYKSVIFYNDDDEKETVLKLIEILKSKGYKVATKLLKSSEFYKAEDYHQDYYKKHKKTPYCHFHRNIF
ncbi:MAG: bifunctional methionine sulfoxide reductase B/A protein [candidate division TA06 bacterium 32_111]|uniref:Peptide methionine sulfoxide reductase MsrA n=1 Tax=candidate division TA06 bacterium 34_109 TaxID=1635277 RepID=A0A101I3T5_UNCT6|nr:MAG: bifunctional methionine sulfoxide reductase B/A protein [candidate division TA06 bacterium 32_111]KUK88248.1 MAG: bifunctional methionine sulfoxide reductase B/A protein [candidate division TA06 bacterium 34_109]